MNLYQNFRAELEAERNKGFINYIKSFFRRKPKTETPPADDEQTRKATAEVQEAENKENEEQKESAENTEEKKEE